MFSWSGSGILEFLICGGLLRTPNDEVMEDLAITKEDAINKLQENGINLQALGVKRMGLFGSFVRGEQKKVIRIIC